MKRPDDTRFEIRAEEQQAVRIFDGAEGWKMGLERAVSPACGPTEPRSCNRHATRRPYRSATTLRHGRRADGAAPGGDVDLHRSRAGHAGAPQEYARKFRPGPEWQHYTGTIEASLAAQRALDVYRGDKMSHTPVTVLRVAPGRPWVHIDGFVTPDKLLEE